MLSAHACTIPRQTARWDSELEAPCRLTLPPCQPRRGERPLTPTKPPSPSSWEETLQQLSQDLKVICSSPETSSDFLATSSSSSSCSPISPPLQSESGSECPNKLLPIRHVQSQEKLRDQLTAICSSPRHKLNASISEPGTVPRTSHLSRSKRRKQTIPLPYFFTSLAIGSRRIEDLHVFIEDNLLQVLPNNPTVELVSQSNAGDLPASIALPRHVNPENLFCIIKNGILEVRESKRRSSASESSVTPPEVDGLLKRRSLSEAAATSDTDCITSGVNGDTAAVVGNKGPIVIESDDRHQLKLVIQVPPGFEMDDIKIKTVDDHLIVSGQKEEELESVASNEDFDSEEVSDTFNECLELFKVFELPEVVDPYSITAELTDKNQLIIRATPTMKVGRASTL